MTDKKPLKLGTDGSTFTQYQTGDTVPVASGGTGATDASGARSNLGAVNIAGDTMTGALTLSGAPSSDLHAATKKYVDDNAGGGGASGNIPINIKSANYTFVAGDAGHNIAKSSTSGYTFTLNNSVFSAGDWFMVSNFGTSANITIARGSGVTLYYAGSTMNSDKIVIPYGMATIYMYSASVGFVSGVGVG